MDRRPLDLSGAYRLRVLRSPRRQLAYFGARCCTRHLVRPQARLRARAHLAPPVEGTLIVAEIRPTASWSIDAYKENITVVESARRACIAQGFWPDFEIFTLRNAVDMVTRRGTLRSHRRTDRLAESPLAGEC